MVVATLEIDCAYVPLALNTNWCLTFSLTLIFHFDKTASFYFLYLNNLYCKFCSGSKTYCGYCKRLKDLLTQLGAAYKVIELDTERKCALNGNALSMEFLFVPLNAWLEAS